MKLTIKNLKVAKFASEETLCFQASVYVDGKKAFTARNEGQGGCNYYDGPRARIEEAEKWASEQPDATGFEDLDTIIDGLIFEAEVTKEVKKLRKKLTIFDAPDILQWRCTPDNLSARSFIAKNHPNAVILNDVSLEQAVTIYRQSA